MREQLGARRARAIAQLERTLRAGLVAELPAKRGQRERDGLGGGAFLDREAAFHEVGPLARVVLVAEHARQRVEQPAALRLPVEPRVVDVARLHPVGLFQQAAEAQRERGD